MIDRIEQIRARVLRVTLDCEDGYLKGEALEDMLYLLERLSVNGKTKPDKAAKKRSRHWARGGG